MGKELAELDNKGIKQQVPSTLGLKSTDKQRNKKSLKVVRSYEYTRFNEQRLSEVYELLLPPEIALKTSLNSIPSENFSHHCSKVI